MAKKKTASKPARTNVEVDGDFNVALPDCVCNDVNLLRRLHHSVVDLIADNEHTAWMISDIELCLQGLADDLFRDAVRDIIAEASEKGQPPMNQP